MIENSQPFGKKFQKTAGGGIFLTHTVGAYWQQRANHIAYRLVQCNTVNSFYYSYSFKFQNDL